MEPPLERDPVKFILLSNSHCRRQRQDLAKVLPSRPQPVASVPSCSFLSYPQLQLTRTISEQVLEARCCFSCATHSLRRGEGWRNFFQIMPLIKVTEESFNWLFFKDINFNIRSNIIYLLKQLECSILYRKMLWHLPNLIFIELFSNKLEKVTNRLRFEV